eukprot:2144106-Rhodomonas_salina.3
MLLLLVRAPGPDPRAACCGTRCGETTDEARACCRCIGSRACPWSCQHAWVAMTRSERWPVDGWRGRSSKGRAQHRLVGVQSLLVLGSGFRIAALEKC